MANKYLVADEVLRETNGGTFNVAFLELNPTHNNTPEEAYEAAEVVSAISDEVKKKINLNYSDLKVAPGIPEDGIATSIEHPAENEEEAWTEITSYNDFHKVAFTGEYTDLNNAPVILRVPEDIDGSSPAYENIQIDGGETIRQLKPLNEVAFTGIAGDGNGIDGGFQVFNLMQYTIQEDNQEDPESFTNKLHDLGRETIIIKNLSVDFFTDISSFLNKFIQNKIPSFISSNSGNYFILNVEKQNGVADNIRYYKVDVALINSSSYTHQFIGMNNLTDEQFDTLASSISVDSSIVCFVFDWDHLAVYCKIDSVNTDIELPELPELADVATSGSYYDLDIKPNLDVSDSSTDITGLATVATTGDYNNLIHTPILNVQDESTNITGLAKVARTNNYNDLSNVPEIVKIVDFTDTVISLSQDRVYSMLDNVYLDNNNEKTIESFLQDLVVSQYSVTGFSYQFLPKIIFLFTDIGVVKIDNMSFNTDVILFNLSTIASTNYLSLDKTNKTDNEILSSITCSIIKITFIIDPNSHKLYIKRNIVV